MDVVAFVDVHPAYRDGPTASLLLGLVSRSLYPHTFLAEVLQFFGARLAHQVVTQQLSRDVVSEFPAAAVGDLHHRVLVAHRVKANLAAPPDAAPLHLVGHALDDRSAQWVGVSGGILGDSAGGGDVPASLRSAALAVVACAPLLELLQEPGGIAHEPRCFADRLPLVPAVLHLLSVLALVRDDPFDLRVL